MNRRLSPWLLAILAVVAPSDLMAADEAFPPATPAECGLENQAVELLAAYVDEQIKGEAAVGAELHIIKDGKTLLHQSFGWADVDEQKKLTIDSIFCVRSMTKPLVGTAIQMLIEEGQLQLEQPVASILPEFDRPDKREITIQHLLTHTSGLPFSTISKPLSEYPSLEAVVSEAASTPLLFDPGKEFQYSDAGSDTLGAVVHRITGSKAEDFIIERVLVPLGMQESFPLLPQQAELRNRVPSAYSGGLGLWQRHWQSSDDRLFPIFLTSQSLYTTTTDYAKFLQLWLQDGQLQEKQLLPKSAIERALASGQKIEGYPVASEGLNLTYGQQWMVYHDDSSHLKAFGHNGSDGTFAWAWPETNLIVLYFTQSRGTMAGVDFESAMNQLLVQGDIEGFQAEQIANAKARESFGSYEGIYWDQDNKLAYYEVYLDGGDLIVERPGRLRALAKPTGEDRKFQWAGQVELEFEAGSPSPAMLMRSGDSIERQLRHRPVESDASIEEVITKVQAAHGMSHLATSGAIKFSGSVAMGPLGLRSKILQWFDRRSLRTEIKGWVTSSTVVINGERVAVSDGGPLKIQEGIVRRQESLGHPSIQFGDWQRGYQELSVLRTVESEGRKLIAVRANALELPAQTLFIDNSTGLLAASQGLAYLPGAGFVGMESRYSDYREVAGMQLPFVVESKFVNPLIGTVVLRFDSADVGVETDGLFEIPE